MLWEQVQVFVTPATAEEYDHMLATSPDHCRPFAAAMGDLRTAAECMAGYEADCQAGLGAWWGTVEGRRAAGRLAEAIGGRFAALVGAGRRGVRLEDGSTL